MKYLCFAARPLQLAIAVRRIFPTKIFRRSLVGIRWPKEGPMDAASIGYTKGRQPDFTWSSDWVEVAKVKSSPSQVWRRLKKMPGKLVKFDCTYTFVRDECRCVTL